MTKATLTARNITVETRHSGHWHKLVDDVSFDLGAGEVLALVGASGSGKSLTCAASLGVLPSGTRCIDGTLAIDGQPQTPASLRGRLVASIMQNPRSAFNAVRTMRAHAMETFRTLGIPASGWESRILDAMTEAGLDRPGQVLQLHPFEMSGGMLQRMMIAIALASGAPFLFADEPTTDLDLIVQRDVLDLLDRLRRDRGLGLLLITHDMGVVARLADRVAVMDSGRIIETAAVHDIFHRPGHPLTRRLVEAHLSLYRLEIAA